MWFSGVDGFLKLNETYETLGHKIHSLADRDGL
jgi:hypothetical protein